MNCPAKIYNNNMKKDSKPCFAILSETPGFGIPEAEARCRNQVIKYIFILINDHQYDLYGDFWENANIDRFFGHRLTGVHLQGTSFSINWKTNGSFNPNIAAVELFTNYHNSSLVVDVLHPKFPRSGPRGKNKRSIDYLFREVIAPFHRASFESGNGSPQFFIVGFGRGAMFAYQLTDLIQQQGFQTGTLITIDPVVSRLSEGELIRKWGVKEIVKRKPKWRIQPWQPLRFQMKNYFPVLREIPDTKVYNVFQRGGFSEDFKSSVVWTIIFPPAAPFLFYQTVHDDRREFQQEIQGDTISGCAIQDSITLCDDHVKLNREHPFDQYDTQKAHSSFTGDAMYYYTSRIYTTFKKYCFEEPEIISITPQGAMPKEEVEIHGWNMEGCPQIVIDTLEVTPSATSSTCTKFIVPDDLQGGAFPLSLLNDQTLTSNTKTLFIAPYIKAIIPPDGYAGDDIHVTGYFSKGDNILFEDEAIFTGFIDSNTLRFSVPGDIGTGLKNVRIKSAHERLSNTMGFNINPAKITKLMPLRSNAGQPLTIKGDGFQKSAKIDIDGQTIVSGFTDHNTLTASLPKSLKPGIRKVTVKQNNTVTNTLSLTIKPFITKIHPEIASPGETITVTGYFSGHQDVTLDGKKIKTDAAATNKAVFKIPRDILGGQKEIQLKDEQKRSSNTGELAVLPCIDQISPEKQISCEKVAIMGHFMKNSLVIMDNKNIETQYKNKQTLWFTVSEEIGVGEKKLWVKDENNTSSIFSFKVSSYIKGIEPMFGGVGDTIQIHGYFANDDQLLINGEPVNTNHLSSRCLSALIPATCPSGPVSVVIENQDKDISNTATLIVTPYIQSVTPDREAPGVQASVKGCFSAGDNIKIDDQDIVSTAWDEREIKFLVPPQSRGKKVLLIESQNKRKSNEASFYIDFIDWFDPENLIPSTAFEYIGNTKTREIHRHSCPRWKKLVKLDNMDHMIGFKTLADAHLLDYDNCHYCLKGSKR